MFKLKSVFLAVCVGLFLIPVTWAQKKDPFAIRIITWDIDNFWNAYDKASPDFDPKVFKKEYIAVGSKGLQGFMKNRIQGHEELAKTVSDNRDYYDFVRESTFTLKENEAQFKAIFFAMKEKYPEASFPDIYFVIGRGNSGGTSFSKGVIIGAEMFGPQPDDGELRAHLSFDILPYLVAHEMIHFQQNLPRSKNLLGQAIREGSADFLGELISGGTINEPTFAWARQREAALWQEFKGVMYEKDYTGWLYGGTKDRPRDLGYWIGYKITQAYYDKAPDKKQAVSDILNIKSFEKFLEDSGYEGR